MIRAIILDDGLNSKEVVVNYGINFKKITFASFLNYLCIIHDSDYKVKTAHYEDLGVFDANIFNEMIRNKFDLFDELWDSEDIVNGIDLY